MSLQLETSPFGIIVRYRDADGAIYSKIVDPKDVADAFASRATMNTGMMPRNTRYYMRTNNKEIIVIEVPEHIGLISYPELDKKFSVPVPNSLFFIEFIPETDSVKFRILNTKVFSSMGPILDSGSMLYKFPYGNVYANGDICWGQTANFKDTTSVVELSIIPMTFLLSDFSRDLSTGNFTIFSYDKVNPDNENGAPVVVSVMTSEHLLQYLDGEKVFPYNILRKEKAFSSLLRDLSD